MNLQKLLSKGHLIPIYNRVEDTIMLIGYRRKASSRKSSQRPFMLKQGIPVGKIPSNPEADGTGDSPESSQKNINEQ
jgi:hypothetical protein